MIGMLATIGQCQPAIRGFSGFPAGSLPCLRFSSIVAAKSMIARGFFGAGESQKNFPLSFPERQGTGEAVSPGQRSAAAILSPSTMVTSAVVLNATA
jgi:hypothetical protein